MEHGPPKHYTTRRNIPEDQEYHIDKPKVP